MIAAVRFSVCRISLAIAVVVCPMARPPQYGRPDDDVTRDVTAVKAAIKHLTPTDRARLMAWLLLYYDDGGMMFSPQISRQRDRITLNGTDFWLTRVPKRPRTP